MPDAELCRIAQEYADLFNGSDPAVIERLIADASIDPYWDGRTNLLSLMAAGPEDLALVLASDPGGENYLVVRFVASWVLDCAAVDWEQLELEAFERRTELNP